MRQSMESFFGASFADVRVHVGHEASALGALAFTQGSHLYFAPGQFDPGTRRGRQLLGHELTHVVQQRAGRVRNPFGAGIAVVHDRGLEAEADRLGARAALHLLPVQPKLRSPAPPPGRHLPRPVQCCRPRTPPGRSLWAPLGRAGVVQRMYNANMTTSVPNLDTVARDLSGSHGYRETATFAVVNQEDADFCVYGQRFYQSTYDQVPTILGGHQIPLGVDYVSPDSNEEHIHAEMLAVSEWLAGTKDKPEMIGASREICLYCGIVLEHLGITVFSRPSTQPTQNWRNPWYCNGQATPLALRGRIPLKYRKKGINYN